jgi:hypothetical protein
MTDKAISPLRRRMIEDMTIRKLASKTQHDYVQRVKDFAAFLGRSPASASKEDLQQFPAVCEDGLLPAEWGGDVGEIEGQFGE